MGLILDAVIESGNPADNKRFIPMLERQADICGEIPDKVSADGGYASKYISSKKKIIIKKLCDFFYKLKSAVYIDLDEAGRLLNSLQKNNKLESLTLNNVECEGKGIEYIAKLLKGNATLITLSLSASRLTDNSISYLAKGLEDNMLLEELYVSRNFITYKGAYILTKAAKCHIKNAASLV